jgi:hypothetical protein
MRPGIIQVERYFFLFLAEIFLFSTLLPPILTPT